MRWTGSIKTAGFRREGQASDERLPDINMIAAVLTSSCNHIYVRNVFDDGFEAQPSLPFKSQLSKITRCVIVPFNKITLLK